MSAKTYLRILQGGIIASLAIVFFVFSSLLFPYITSKQIPFNILMEILLAFWLVLIIRYPQYRPHKNYISWGLIAYFLAILASCLISVDFNLSFWGNTERMLGLFQLLHFLIFYFILITVFRSWREWKLLLIASVVIATVVSIIGLGSGPVYSVIGNTTYVSAYLIFNLFFAAILFFKERAFWRWLYPLSAIIMLLEFVSARTAGAVIALAISVLLFVFLLALFQQHKKQRRLFWGLLLVLIIGIVFVFLQRNSAWFQHDQALKDINFEKNTFQTRLFSWESAWLDFGHHPILGTGYGNYAITFDRYFNPQFLNQARTETYFDRAHNNLINIASTTGLVGLATYLSIFVAVLFYLYLEFKRNGRVVTGRGNLEVLLIISLLTAYFIQNLAVFDSFTTYIGLMIVLAYSYWFWHRHELPAQIEVKSVLANWRLEFGLLFVLLAIVSLPIYYFNVRPAQVFTRVLTGYSQLKQGEPVKGLASFRKALAIKGILDRDARAVLINFSIANPHWFNYLGKDQSKPALDYVISLAQKNVSYNPQDSMMQMQLAEVLGIATRDNYDNLKLFNYYSAQSLRAINEAIASSPGRVNVRLIKAQFLLERGETKKAITAVEQAIDLNKQFPDAYCRLAQIKIFLKEDPNYGSALDNCLRLGGANFINSSSLLKSAIVYYANRQENKSAIILAQRLLKIDKDDPEVYFNLAKFYRLVGDQEKAKTFAQQALNLDSRLKPRVQALLEKLVTTKQKK